MVQTTAQTDADQPYIPVSVATLIPETSLGAALYLSADDTGKMQLYRGPNVPLEKTDLGKLLGRGHKKVFVAAEEHASYQQYLRENLDEILEDETQSVTQRFASLNEVVRDVLATAFRAEDADETVATCRNLAENTVGLIC